MGAGAIRSKERERAITPGEHVSRTQRETGYQPSPSGRPRRNR
jgi:hypothetical protein